MSDHYCCRTCHQHYDFCKCEGVFVTLPVCKPKLKHNIGKTTIFDPQKEIKELKERLKVLEKALNNAK